MTKGLNKKQLANLNQIIIGVKQQSANRGETIKNDLLTPEQMLEITPEEYEVIEAYKELFPNILYLLEYFARFNERIKEDTIEKKGNEILGEICKTLLKIKKDMYNKQINPNLINTDVIKPILENMLRGVKRQDDNYDCLGEVAWGYPELIEALYTENVKTIYSNGVSPCNNPPYNGEAAFIIAKSKNYLSSKVIFDYELLRNHELGRGTDFTEEERQEFFQVVDSIFADFLGKIAAIQRPDDSTKAHQELEIKLELFKKAMMNINILKTWPDFDKEDYIRYMVFLQKACNRLPKEKIKDLADYISKNGAKKWMIKGFSKIWPDYIEALYDEGFVPLKDMDKIEDYQELEKQFSSMCDKINKCKCRLQARLVAALVKNKDYNKNLLNMIYKRGAQLYDNQNPYSEAEEKYLARIVELLNSLSQKSGESSATITGTLTKIFNHIVMRNNSENNNPATRELILCAVLDILEKTNSSKSMVAHTYAVRSYLGMVENVTNPHSLLAGAHIAGTIGKDYSGPEYISLLKEFTSSPGPVNLNDLQDGQQFILFVTGNPRPINQVETYPGDYTMTADHKMLSCIIEEKSFDKTLAALPDDYDSSQENVTISFDVGENTQLDSDLYKIYQKALKQPQQ